MEIVDNLAGIVAKRHSGKVCVTLGIDSVRFLAPARRGDILFCKASVNRTWNSSMEVGIKVIAEGFRSLENKQIRTAYFTFVAVDDEHRPIKVLPVFPETEEEKRRFHQAEERRQFRFRQKS